MSGTGAKVVALVGVSGSGRSIVARRLVGAHGFARLRFSDPMRDMLRAGFGIPDIELEGKASARPQARFGGFSHNRLLTSLANDWGRGDVHAKLWTNEWRRRLEGMTGYVLADDVGRLVEADAVREVGGIIVRITRPGFAPLRPALSDGIRHDIELVNEGREEMVAVADSFACQLARLAVA